MPLKRSQISIEDIANQELLTNDILRSLESRVASAQQDCRAAQEELDRLRWNLSRIIPHELGTPLNVVVSTAELLKGAEANLSGEEIRGQITLIHSAALRLRHHLRNILAFMDIELARSAGAKYTPTSDDLPVYSLKNTIVSVALSVAQTFGRVSDLALSLEEGESNIPSIYLEKIAGELLDNAFRYSGSGSTVSVALMIVDGSALISITDHGRGFCPGETEEIGGYVQFGRAKHEQQGMGIGFALSKGLIEFLNGHLLIDSEVGIGTTVLVTLPRIGGGGSSIANIRSGPAQGQSSFAARMKSVIT